MTCASQASKRWYHDSKGTSFNATLSVSNLTFGSQIRELQQANSQPLGFAAQCSATAVVALGLSLYYAWSLTLVTLALVPLSTVALAWISAQMQWAVGRHADCLMQASKLASSSVFSIGTVKTLNGQNFEIWQYSTAIQRAAKYFLAQAHGSAMQIGFVRLMTLGMFVQGFW